MAAKRSKKQIADKEYSVKKGGPAGKKENFDCPNCGAQLRVKDGLLHTEKSHKDWYNVPGKLGKQRGKPKHDINPK